MNRYNLNAFFEPKTIAVIGASDRQGSLGYRVMKNLLEKPYSGVIFPINLKHRKVMGLKAYERLKLIDKPIDLAIITSDVDTIPDQIDACGEAHVKCVIVLTHIEQLPGSREAFFYEQLRTRTRKQGLPLIGPNGFGVVNANLGSKATYHSGEVLPGNIALVSQSGAICSAIVDWAKSNSVGFSHIVCLEQSQGIDIGDVLNYLLVDPRTESILLYIEGVHDARHFLSGLRAAARGKPVIALKTGRHIKEENKTMLHTGALVGNEDVFNAAFDRAGVVRASTINDLFLGARAFLTHRKVHGDKIAIISNGNAPISMACDTAFDFGLSLAELNPHTKNELTQRLSCPVSVRNPVQLVADAHSDCFLKAYELVEADPAVNIVVVIFTPQHGAAPSVSAQQVIETAKKSQKALIACWMGDAQVSDARRLFHQAGIPVFATPENAMKAVHFLVTYYNNRRLLLQTPEPLMEKEGADTEGARLIIEGVLQEGRKYLSQLESKAILRAFRIPVSQAMVTYSPNEALVAAESLGFPIALKINSPDILHKADAEGVLLGITNAASVRSAYNQLLENVTLKRPNAKINGVIVEAMADSSHARELLVGFKTDPVFGPVIVFGAGGTMVELMADYAISLPPLNEFLARNLIERTRIRKLLAQFRHLPAVNLDKLIELLLRLSEMACELPWIRNLEINPLLADDEKVIALDARVEIDYITPAQERYAHIAIHPYPAYLTAHWQLKDGTDIEIRPIRPEDAEIEKEFIENLSPQSRYYRFMHTLKHVSPEMLVRFTQIDYHRELALIAVVKKEGVEIEIGVSRYVLNAEGDSCEFAVVVADQWQHTGIGYKLMEKLIEAARTKGIPQMDGVVLKDNEPMKRLARSLGFEVQRHETDEEVVVVVKAL